MKKKNRKMAAARLGPDQSGGFKPLPSDSSWMDNLDYKVMKMDGYDDCAIGVLERIGQDPIIVYDKQMVLDKLMSEGCSEIDAIEWYEYNMLGAYVGEGTPGFLVRPEAL